MRFFVKGEKGRNRNACRFTRIDRWRVNFNLLEETFPLMVFEEINCLISSHDEMESKNRRIIILILTFRTKRWNCCNISIFRPGANNLYADTNQKLSELIKIISILFQRLCLSNISFAQTNYNVVTDHWISLNLQTFYK